MTLAQPALYLFLFAMIFMSILAFILTKGRRNKLLREFSPQFAGKQQAVSQLDSALEAILSKADQLVALDEVEELRKKADELRLSFEDMQSQMLVLRASADKEIAAAEKELAEFVALKKNISESRKLAREVKAKRDKQLEEAVQLDGQIKQSQMSMEEAVKEVPEEHQETIKKLSETYQDAVEQLITLREIQAQGVKRYLNLQQQYEELDKEHRELLASEGNRQGP